MFKGTLQEYARITNNDAILHHILMHDSYYYFNQEDIDVVSENINVRKWHVSGMEFPSWIIKSKVLRHEAVLKVYNGKDGLQKVGF